MELWHATAADIWQGRNDLSEADNALRLFQTVTHCTTFTPEDFPHHTALIGFECDEGVKLNQGRVGARHGPEQIRRAMANMASHHGHDTLVDLGNIQAPSGHLETAQRTLSEAVTECHRQQMKTLVLGGGHETAFAHGRGIYAAYPRQKVGIINFDAHLDVRRSEQGTSGTPFRQLAHYCQHEKRVFQYTCVGASLAANTQALVEEATHLNTTVIWDTDCSEELLDNVSRQLKLVMDNCDVIYLTVDLDVLPAWQMPAVSAPAPLGLSLNVLLRLIRPICQSQKLVAADLVELNPNFDIDHQSAKVAARLAWQIAHWWK